MSKKHKDYYLYSDKNKDAFCKIFQKPLDIQKRNFDLDCSGCSSFDRDSSQFRRKNSQCNSVSFSFHNQSLLRLVAINRTYPGIWSVFSANTDVAVVLDTERYWLPRQHSSHKKGAREGSHYAQDIDNNIPDRCRVWIYYQPLDPVKNSPSILLP